LVPDADLILRLFGDEVFLKYHRGFGNSLFLIPPVALGLAFVFNRLSSKKNFLLFFILCFLSVAVHTFLDLQTSFGTMLLFPFSDRRFSLDLVFIIDPYYSGILIAGLIFSIFIKKYSERICQLSLMVIVLYTVLCAFAHSRALNLGYEYAKAKGLEAVEVAALPQPLSPFRWANYIETEKEIHQGFVDLLKKPSDTGERTVTFLGRYRARFNAPEKVVYRVWEKFPNSQWVEKALRLEAASFFLWFSRFPVVIENNALNGFHVVRFFDLQFSTIEGRYPFLYEVVFDAKGDVYSQGFQSK
ncbi:MAG: metal-dependent hydrolase, partial [Nitrospirae bacterium]|nr:metal-dependent hydrolase [Nitrospirota bacterium]